MRVCVCVGVGMGAGVGVDGGVQGGCAEEGGIGFAPPGFDSIPEEEKEQRVSN